MKKLPLLFLVAISFNPKLIKKVGECSGAADGQQSIYLLKQWHLPPSVNTKAEALGTAHPQKENQTQIYDQLSEWVKAGSIDRILAEGCEGDLTQLKEAYQGWTLRDLKSHANESKFNEILSHPVLKIFAKYQSSVSAYCGDNLTEIKKSQLALSDARADIGYYSRLEQYRKDPAKLKPYLDGVTETYHLKKETKVEDALFALKLDLKASIKQFQTSTHERDLSFLKSLPKRDLSKKPTIVVIGGLHTQDLKQIFEENKLPCLIFEPLSYQNDEEAMLNKLNSLNP